MIACLALLASAPFQQSIERELRYEVTESGGTEVAPATGSSFFLPSVSITASVPFAIPTGDRVHLREVFVQGRYRGVVDVDVTALEPGGSTIVGAMESGSFACGGFCSWGPSDFTSSGNTLGTFETLSAGESRVFSQGLMDCGLAECSLEQTFNESSFSWDAVIQGPVFDTGVQIFGTGLAGSTPAGGTAPFQLNRFASDVSATSVVVTRHELDAAPLSEYCTSPTGSTGVPASLAAFGSQQAGTEYLTIRAQELPADSFALLFVATAAANVPMGSYNLCVGGTLQREGGVQPTGAGSADFDIALMDQAVGETVFLQALFRDPVLGVGATGGSSFVVDAN